MGDWKHGHNILQSSYQKLEAISPNLEFRLALWFVWPIGVGKLNIMWVLENSPKSPCCLCFFSLLRKLSHTADKRPTWKREDLLIANTTTPNIRESGHHKPSIFLPSHSRLQLHEWDKEVSVTTKQNKTITAWCNHRILRNNKSFESNVLSQFVIQW